MTYERHDLGRSPTPELIVAAARSGDHAAIGQLAGDAFRASVAFYRYTGVSADHAEDLAADAVESIISRLPTLRSAGKYDAWMWSIVRNRLRDFWRARRSGTPAEPISPPPMSPDEVAIVHEEHDQVRTALGTLALRDRELLWLREVHGLNYRDIGERMGMSAATARVASHRARKALQQAFERVD